MNPRQNELPRKGDGMSEDSKKKIIQAIKEILPSLNDKKLKKLFSYAISLRDN